MTSEQAARFVIIQDHLEGIVGLLEDIRSEDWNPLILDKYRIAIQGYLALLDQEETRILLEKSLYGNTSNIRKRIRKLNQRRARALSILF